MLCAVSPVNYIIWPFTLLLLATQYSYARLPHEKHKLALPILLSGAFPNPITSSVMPLFGRNHGRSNASSPSSSKPTFTMQKLLYSQPPPFDTTVSCIAGNIPASALIEKLYSSIITAYSVLSFPEDSEDDLKWAPICANFGKFAIFVDRGLSSLANDCCVVRERYQGAGNEDLLAEIFRTLAETLFLACT